MVLLQQIVVSHLIFQNFCNPRKVTFYWLVILIYIYISIYNLKQHVSSHQRERSRTLHVVFVLGLEMREI